MFHLSPTLVLFLLPFINAQTPIRTASSSISTPSSSPFPTPTQSIILTHLVPPYGPGYANYFASVVRVEPSKNETYFAITCIPYSTQGGFNPNIPDPCLTSYLGTESQNFVQGQGNWAALRTGTIVNASSTRWMNQDTTKCQWPTTGISIPKTNLTATYDIRNATCTAITSVHGSKYQQSYVTETGEGGSRFGLSTQRVTVTAGLNELAERTQLSTKPQFTDLGKSDTIAPPRVTVTLVVQPGQGSSTRNVEISWLGLLVASVWGLWLSMLP